MRLTFERSGVNELLRHTRAAPRHAQLYNDPATARPGLWLVGDEGVYLMSNGDPALMAHGPKETRRIVYAAQVDPTKFGFDEWWEAKRRSFGGDDGCNFLEYAAIIRALATWGPTDPLTLEMTPGYLALVLRTGEPKIAAA
jgi:hypothetical protein